MISCATNTVFMVIGAGERAFTKVPSGSRISTLRKAPSFLGRSGSKNAASAMNTAEVVLAIELFLKPRICGEVPAKSTIKRRSFTVRVTAILPAVGMRQHAFEEGVGAVGAQFLDQERQPFGADAGRADHGAQVAVEGVGQAGVDE